MKHIGHLPAAENTAAMPKLNEVLLDKVAAATGKLFCNYCQKLVAAERVRMRQTSRGRRMYLCVNCENKRRQAESKRTPLT